MSNLYRLLNKAVNKKIIYLSFFLLLTALFLLLYNPAYMKTIKKNSKHKLNLYIDNSQSMLQSRAQIMQELEPFYDNDTLATSFCFFSDNVTYADDKNILNKIPFYGSGSYFFNIKKALKTAALDHKQIIISDYNFQDESSSLSSRNIYHYAVNNYTQDIAVKINLPNHRGFIKKNMPAVIPVKIYKNYSRSVTFTLSLKINKFKNSRLEFFKTNIFLKKNQLTVKFNFTPPEKTLYTATARVSSIKGPNGLKLNDRDWLILQARQKDYNYYILSFSPDYEIKSLKLFFDKYRQFSYRARSFFFSPEHQKEKKNKIKNIVLKDNEIIILFAPPARVFNYFRNLDKKIIYFPLNKISRAQKIFHNRLQIKHNPQQTAADFNYDYDIFKLDNDHIHNKKIWQAVPPFNLSIQVPTNTHRDLFHIDKQHSALCSSENLLFLGLYPLTGIKKASSVKAGQNYYESFLYNLLTSFSSKSFTENIFKNQRHNFTRYQQVALKKNIIIKNKVFKNQLPHSITKDPGIHYYQTESGNNSGAFSIRLPLAEYFFQRPPPAYTKKLSRLHSLYTNLVQSPLTVTTIKKKHYIFKTVVFFISCFLLFIVFAALKKIYIRKNNELG